MRFVLFLVIGLIVSLPASAQKYGHVNFGNLLSEMPDVATAEKALQDFEKAELTKGEAMVAKLEARAKEAQANLDETTPKELETIKRALAAEEQKIRTFEQNMARAIEKKRQELLGPIIKRAKEAVEAVAREEGYDMVFDSSIFGNILFAQEMTDLMPLVKAKL